VVLTRAIELSTRQGKVIGTAGAPFQDRTAPFSVGFAAEP